MGNGGVESSLFGYPASGEVERDGRKQQQFRHDLGGGAGGVARIPRGLPLRGRIFAGTAILPPAPVMERTRRRKIAVPLDAGSGLAVELEVQARWIKAVTHRFDSIKDADNYCRGLEHLLKVAKIGDVLVDGRRHQSGTREANERIWKWVDECGLLKRMALLNESPNLAAAIRMRNLASPVRKVKPFQSQLAAERWLLTGR